MKSKKYIALALLISISNFSGVIMASDNYREATLVDMDDRNDIDINANGEDQEEEKQEGTDIEDLDNDVDGGELVEETKPDIQDPIEENVISQENLLPLV